MSASDDPSALVGAVLNQRWRLTRVIGFGGLAVVYEAIGVQGEGTYAMKLLRPEFCGEPSIVERFVNEAAASARVVHPGIARVFEAQRAEDGTPYLVMELLEGQPLSARMNRGRMPVEQAAPIAHGILMALAAAHGAGVVHRDLKPDNVFLVRDVSGQVNVKVLDFGIARVVDAAGGLGRKTRTGMVLGTPGYMSPEQIKNSKDADHRSDLWAVGLLYYEMLTGVPAFPAENDFAKVTAALFSEPTSIQQVAPQYAHWAGFFQRAIAREPAARFQSATEMAQALWAVAHEGQMPHSEVVAIPMSDLGTAPTAPNAQAPMLAQAAPREVLAANPPRAGAFGNVNTAISAGPLAAPAEPRPAEPMVQVITPQRRGIPAWVLAVSVLFALLFGFGCGFLVGRL
jgi:eukaryotic-like serine/threonine-protein kinase